MFNNKFYKQFLAIVVALVIVGGASFAYITTNKIQLGLTPIKKPDINTQLQADSDRAINNLKGTLSTARPEKLVYETINLDDLQVYPKSWISRNFAKNQIDNQLITGAESDPDGDGLSNRQEFLYGANPLKKDTYCGVETETKDTKCPKTDKQMIEAQLNPLTGLELEIKKQFKVKKIDKNIAEGVETSFEVASDQGFDFPKLYEESRKLNLTNEFNKVKVITQKNTGEGILDYYKTRLDILKEFAQDDELSSFNNIYGVLETAKLDELLTKYQSILNKLNGTIVPELMSDYHKANIMVIQKLIVVINNRKDAFGKSQLPTQEEINISQTQAREMLWAYRNLNDQQNLVQAEIEKDYPVQTVSSVQ